MDADQRRTQRDKFVRAGISAFAAALSASVGGGLARGATWMVHAVGAGGEKSGNMFVRLCAVLTGIVGGVVTWRSTVSYPDHHTGKNSDCSPLGTAMMNRLNLVEHVELNSVEHVEQLSKSRSIVSINDR